MSNYTPTTAFGPKDSLPTSSPLKTIYGAAYDTEFNNIATAISSKYDSNTTTITLSGNFSAGNISTGGTLASTGALSAGSISTAGALSAGSITTAGALSAGSLTVGGKVVGPVGYTSAGQTITSNTTLVNATGLSASLAVGTYLIQLRLNWYGTGGVTTQGYKFGTTYSGTFSNYPGGLIVLSGNGTTATTYYSAGSAVTSSNISSNIATPDFTQLDLMAVTTTTGTFNVQIAQGTSNIAGTVLAPGSALIVTRLA